MYAVSLVQGSIASLKINEDCFHVASILLDVSSMDLRVLVDAICSISSTCTIILTMLSINIFIV